MKKAAKILLWVIVSSVAVFLLSMLSWYQLVRLSVAHASTDNLEEVPKHRVALLLGTTSTLENGKANPYFSNRIDAVVELYNAGKAETILLSGHGGPYYSETRKMSEALIKKGVPKNSIISDPEGYRTLDSMIRAHDIFQLNSFIIVSQAFHTHRALYICRKRGIDAVAYEAKSVSNIRLWAWNSLREHLARVKMALDLYLFDTMPQSMDPVQSPAATSLAK